MFKFFCILLQVPCCFYTGKMPLHKVKVKWGRTLLDSVELNNDEIPLAFKSRLYALTGVRPERQKVLIKGAIVKDDTWGNSSIVDGTTVLLMGTTEDNVPVKPTTPTRFVEDLDESELAAASNLPAGLMNMGNTCYLNATVQCLKTIPELRQALREYTGRLNITSALKDLYFHLDKGLRLPPVILLEVLHRSYPRFAERDNTGQYVQQDANECWTEILRDLQTNLKSAIVEGAITKHSNLIDQCMGGTFDIELKCIESDLEPVTKTQENFLQLSCFISHDVKYIMSGLKCKLMETIEKNSSVLQTNAKFLKTSRISRLPVYLTIQFVRFFFKEKELVNAKILKEIKFPVEFDAYELCSMELQEKLLPMRDRFKEQDDKAASLSSPVWRDSATPYYFPDDFGSNNSGYYTLQAVLTHRGRSSSSGHYVAWVRQTAGKWVKFDDDVISLATEEDVLKLCGGGDWHCAYVLLYGPKRLKIVVEQS